jgi:hypothetical protein
VELGLGLALRWVQRRVQKRAVALSSVLPESEEFPPLVVGRAVWSELDPALVPRLAVDSQLQVRAVGQ